MRGTIEINIGGKLRPIKFGTNQSARYCQVRGVTLAEMQKELEHIETSDGSSIRDLIYSALWAGCKTDKLEVDFDEYDMGDWIDEMGQEELNKIFQVLIDSNDSGKEEEGSDAKGEKK